MMRERIRDSLPQQSSPSRSTDGNGNESSRYKRRNVPSRSGQSPVQIGRDSHGFEVIRTDREQCVDGIRRECGYSSPYEVERQIRGGFSDMDRREEDGDNGRHMRHYHLQKYALISGDDYPNRSNPTETVYHGLGGLGSIQSAEETYRRRDTESFRSTMNQCLSDELEPSRFTTPRDYTNVLRNDEIERLESNSRGYSVSCRRHRLNPYRKSEQGQTEAIFVATKGEHYSDDGRDRDAYKIQESSPLSQIGSSVVDSQDESSRRCVRVNDLDDYSGDPFASQVLQSRQLEDHVGRNSSRGKGKSFQNLSYSQDFGCAGHDSPAMSRCGKEIVDESRQNYEMGYDIAVREFPSVRHDVKNMARETDVLVQTGGYGSNRVDVDATDTHLEFNTRERITDQYDFVKGHYPLVELGSHVVNEREDKAHHYRDGCYDEQREVVSSDNKCQLLRKDYQHDGVDGSMYLDFRGPYAMVDDKAQRSTTLCLNKEREAYLENERKAAYSENRKHELRNEYHFGNDGRMHSDVHGEDIVVDQDQDQDGRVLQLQQVCLNKGDIVVDRDGRVVQLQQVCLNKGSERDYDSGSDARIYRDVNRLDIAVDREDVRGLRYRGVSINDTKEAYMQSESQQLLKYHETGSYGIMHPNVNKPDRGLRYRGVSANDTEEAYMQCESQQLLNDRVSDSYSYGMMHPDVNKSYIGVDREVAGVRRYRGVSLNDRKEAYLQCESQQLLKDRETNSYGMMHPDVNKSYIQVDREDVRALERRGGSFVVGNESYLDNGRRDAYLRYESQQLKKDYDYGIDDRIYGDINSSYIGLDQGNAKALELRRGSFNDGNEAYLDSESRDVYMHYRIPQPKKDYDSGIDAGIYHDVNRSEIVVDQEFASAPELRREAYLQYENKYLLKDHETDAYGVMHPDVSRSSARKHDEEALGRRRYLIDDDRNQVYLNDDERLQLRNGGHVKAHANRRYSEMLLARDEYGLRDEAAGEVIHENVAEDYNNYGDVKQLGMSYEKVDHSGSFHDHGYRDKLRNYEVEGGTSMKQFRDLVDERSFRNDKHQDSTLRPRISAKDRLGGRVGDSGVLVRNRGLHRVRNSNLKGKSNNRRKEVAFSQHG